MTLAEKVADLFRAWLREDEERNPCEDATDCEACAADRAALYRAEAGSIVELTCKRHHEAANVTSLRDMVERTRVRT